MRNISEMSVIQIEVTNVCDRTCSNCTRFCGHHTKERRFFIELPDFRNALESLKTYDGIVGLIGGEPTLHPQFPELCRIFAELRPDKKKRGLWSNTRGRFDQYRQIINGTFGYFNLNDHHSFPVMHTPILVASEDVEMAAEPRAHCIENCWVQNTWSASITPKGAFFCEVAGTLSILFNGPNGWDVVKEPEWWKKTKTEYREQMAWACRRCGCALPLVPRQCSEVIDDVSPSNLELLKEVGSPKVRRGQYEVYTKGVDDTQKRDVTWYWSKHMLSWPRKLYRRINRIVRRLPRNT